MRIFRFFVLCFIMIEIVKGDNTCFPIIPYPNYIEVDTCKKIQFDGGIEISYENITGKLISFINDELEVLSTVEKKTDKKTVFFFKVDEHCYHISEEGYEISGKPGDINIVAKGRKGIFYALQSLKQVFASQAFQRERVLPAFFIHDAPRFPWRGFMLDVSRHFMTVDKVKRFLDDMALYKLNRFHWHLTDDHGWRLEIKRYPKLTEIGAWRVDREDEPWGERKPIREGEKATYGGYYTQEQVKEIVEYAMERNIMVVPEIDMPGHCQAVAASYPEYSCTHAKIGVNPGGPVAGKDINVLCAGNPELYHFVEGIIEETAELFPGPFIHIGGDECDKKYWKECSECQNLIRKNNLKNEEELQSYFIHKVEEMVLKNGKHMIGWDEIMQGGLAPNAIVQAWWGLHRAVMAVEKKHPVICSPMHHTYLDYPIEKYDLYHFYQYDPVPYQLNSYEKKLVWGGECHMWSEKTPQAIVDSMVFPRMIAISEAFWTEKDNKDFNRFYQNMGNAYEYMDRERIKYGPMGKEVRIISRFIPKDNHYLVSLLGRWKENSLYYIFSEEKGDWMKYQNPFIVKGKRTIVAKNREYPEKKDTLTLHPHLALNSHIQIEPSYDYRYSGHGKTTLIDGVLGGKDFRDNRWLGFEGNSPVFKIQLNEREAVSSITVRALQNPGAFLFLPVKIEVWGSKDGEKFEKIEEIGHRISLKEEVIHSFTTNSLNKKYQTIKIKTTNAGPCPEWHAGRGEPSWIFLDEIIVQ